MPYKRLPLGVAAVVIAVLSIFSWLIAVEATLVGIKILLALRRLAG